ncbi:hypothetical protein BDV23DRAFT_174933 [Aspergillus alliaceus]|uniref:Uncharacterized protein n=1 Tax=Petromyces alliaceus TaxID=209559 RepID=A0A5N7C007_PETAA|nr:hypothetical protein BDV23DRAFT_174933 [Aspergillus alliaceus]
MLPEGFKTIKLENHNNAEIKRSVLDHTKREYDRALTYFDIFVANREGAVSPPDIRTYKGFMEFLGKNLKGHLTKGKTPVLSTLEGMRRDLDTEHVSTTIKEWMKKELKIIQKHLWCQDLYEYRGICPERSSVELSVSMLLYCFTSARTGEVYKSTACQNLAHEHGGQNIEWIGGEIMLVLYYDRDYFKGFWRKDKSELPIHGFYEKYTEEMPLTLNLLTFFLPLASADKAFRDYDSTDGILDRVDLLAATLQEGDDKSVDAIHFKPHILNTPVFCPYNEQAIVYSTGRSREADAFDKNHSKTARMKQSYVHHVVEVDGAASFLGIDSRHDHIENNRSMGARRNPQLYRSLPAKAELEFLDHNNIARIDKDIQSLKRQLAGLNLQNTNAQTLFYYVQKVMPERDLLAVIPPQVAELHSPTGCVALHALETIFSQIASVCYWPSIAPVDGKCLCSEPMESVDNFAELCVECDLWYNDLGKRPEHCEEHLGDSYKLLPGLCPFCLGEEIMGPRKHMMQYFDRSDHKALSGMFHRRHPACHEDFQGITDLEYHLRDVHCYNPPRGKKRAIYHSGTER